MFGYVPDGVYDKQDYLTRYKIVEGRPTIVISKMWLDKGGPDEVDASLKLPWGSYPDMPPKPPKK